MEKIIIKVDGIYVKNITDAKQKIAFLDAIATEIENLLPKSGEVKIVFFLNSSLTTDKSIVFESHHEKEFDHSSVFGYPGVQELIVENLKELKIYKNRNVYFRAGYISRYMKGRKIEPKTEKFSSKEFSQN
jgi:hypothetical protein